MQSYQENNTKVTKSVWKWIKKKREEVTDWTICVGFCFLVCKDWFVKWVWEFKGI